MSTSTSLQVQALFSSKVARFNQYRHPCDIRNLVPRPPSIIPRSSSRIPNQQRATISRSIRPHIQQPIPDLETRVSNLRIITLEQRNTSTILPTGINPARQRKPIINIDFHKRPINKNTHSNRLRLRRPITIHLVWLKEPDMG